MSWLGESSMMKSGSVVFSHMDQVLFGKSAAAAIAEELSAPQC